MSGNHPQASEKPSGLDSRSFALSLIVIASLYVLFMICKAYKNSVDDDSQSDFVGQQYSNSYEYVTPSYDFEQYQSHDDHAQIKREFQYNESLNDSTSIQDRGDLSVRDNYHNAGFDRSIDIKL